MLHVVARWGFKSMNQLREWFDYFGQCGYDELKRAGFGVSVYESDDVCEYYYQVTFDGHTAKLIERLELPTIQESRL